jgi:hypothetical protein
VVFDRVQRQLQGTCNSYFGISELHARISSAISAVGSAWRDGSGREARHENVAGAGHVSRPLTVASTLGFAGPAPFTRKGGS